MPHNQAKSPTQDDIYTGQRLKAARLLKGLSQQKLGQELGVTFQQIQKYENGKNRLSASRLFLAAEALGVEPSYFFTRPDRTEAGLASADEETNLLSTLASSQDGLELNEYFWRIEDETTRRRVIDLVVAIAAAHADGQD